MKLSKTRTGIALALIFILSSASIQASWKICNQTESNYIVVNRQNPVDEDFIPDSLVVPDVPFTFNGFHEKRQLVEVAGRALEELFAQADQQGVNFKAVSGYRSYQRQKQIFNANVSEKGLTEASRVSARPGQSEHQTGLAIDISSASVGYDLIEELGDTIEGKWLEQNAYKSGFIIRYPKEKEDITGYMYEPWHIRYVGKELATYLYVNDFVLEDVFNCKVVVTRRPICLTYKAVRK